MRTRGRGSEKKEEEGKSCSSRALGVDLLLDIHLGGVAWRGVARRVVARRGVVRRGVARGADRQL